MGEIKSVKVDNWGVFFLQKLQNFFNKTDYCDLTLQFRDNSQLKVHRLVLSACTDFFNVLEQTCELIDDALVMPNELQADVVVPIVNFMYTGTLEFELRMYNKLLKTAREMNMTVLLKLLEAHKRTMESSIKVPPRSGSPKLKTKRLISSPTIAKILPSSVVSSTQQRRKVITGTPTTPGRRIITAKTPSVANIFRQSTNSLLKVTPKMQRGPTRFETTDPNTPSDAYEPSFDSISYESKPMKEEPEEYEEMQTSPAKHRSSPFEQLRKGYNNNKRPAISAFTSPPAKKPNIEDVKEFSEQQRMRKQIAAEYGDDAEYDGVMDDDIHNDDDDEEPSSNPSSKQQTPQTQPQGSIIIKQSPNEKPTIVVKDSSNSKMDHAKIISEVLRQYPHLVKGNKNIKLKIMPNVGGQPQKIIVKKEAIENATADTEPTKHQQAQQQLLQISQKQTRITSKGQILKPSTSTKVEGQTTATVTSVETVASADSAANASKSAPAEPTQKRRIDSKTMHVLIAQGAANTTGPWLCLRCGLNGRPISIPTYRGFRRHLINTHKEVIDPALCEQCGWRSSNARQLSHHMLVDHNFPSLTYAHPKCEHCKQICVDKNDLDLHLEKVHPNLHKQLCIYCNKVFFKEMQLYTHMKTFHKKLAREDGVIDFSEDELTDFDDEIKNIHPQSSTEDKKIKIISDIALPSTILKLEDVQQVEEDFGNDSGPKFVNADGNEMVLTAEQREEIMSQLEQDHDGGVVMVLNEPAFPQGEAVVAGQEPKTEALDDYNDANIYNEFPDEETAGEFSGQEASAEVGALDGTKEEEEDEEETHEQDPEESGHEERIDEDHMEWAENLISAHDADDNDHDEDEEEPDVGDEEIDDDEEILRKTTSKIRVTKNDEEKVSSSDNLKGDTPKSEDDISMKLKELTGDWSDDEIEDDDEGEDEVKRDVDESDKNKTDEDLQAQLTGENTPEKPTSKDVEDVAKKTEEIKDSPAKVEAKPKPTLAKDDTADQISESKQSEKTEDEEILSKEDIKEESLSSKDLNISADSPLETKTSDKIIYDEEAKEKPDSSTTEEIKPRRTSSTDKVKPTEVPLLTDEDKSLDEATSEESSKKISSLEKANDDFLETDDKQNDDKEQKVESSSDKEDTVTSSKSSKEDSLKSVDKVKSLISEWADDDDEI